ncbi:MAG: hypothetical protein ACI31M_00995 [Bacilli bacterium]
MSYIWIKYSPYSDGTEMTDNINDFTKVHTYEAILDSSTNTDWTDIVFKIRHLNGSVQISDIEITIDGDSTNYYTGENLDITTDDVNYWVTLSVNNNSNLIGNQIKVKFNFIVSQRTRSIYFLTFFNNDWDNSNNRYDIPLDSVYIGICEGQESPTESDDNTVYTWKLLSENDLGEGSSSQETAGTNIEENGEEYQDSYSSPLSTGTGESGIEGMSEDSWGNENYGLPCALYFYYMGDDINAGNEYENWNTEYTNAVLGNCSAIQSVQYVPFLRKDDLMLNAVPYDIARFGQLQASHPKLDYAPYVYRVKALTTQVKTIGSFNCYTPSKSIGGARNWRNESRLYNYPYQFAMITDHLNPPMEIKYHLVPSSQATVKVIQTISDRCSYGLYVEGYKGDNGQLEAMVSGEAHELPCSSSAYNQWFATNKNQVAQNVRNMSETAFLQNGNIIDNQKYNILNSTVGVIGSALSGNIGGMVSSVIGGFQNNMNMNFQQRMNNVGVQQQVAMNLAQQQDLRNTPNTIISMGSDVYYGLAKGGFSLDVYKFGLTNEYNQKLGDYFAMYGYKQNKVMNINTQNRYYYNYIKTVGANVQSSKIPRSHLEEIKSILDNGVTIWHTFRDGVTVGDYSMDNKEV